MSTKVVSAQLQHKSFCLLFSSYCAQYNPSKIVYAINVKWYSQIATVKMLTKEKYTSPKLKQSSLWGVNNDADNIDVWKKQN